MVKKRSSVAVIGAGPSGLVAVKSLLEMGLQPVAFEKADAIGGLWRYDESKPDGGGVAYRSLKTNTSKWMGVFSDFPFAPEIPAFPTREQLLAYLNQYADHFDLRTYVRLNSVVKRISPTQDGRWTVVCEQEGLPAIVETFDAVVVASGFYPVPFQPELPGLDRFEGEVLHSYAYKGPEDFSGKRVVIVGCGSSGADLAGEMGAVAASVDVSTRKGLWFLPKMIRGRAYDTYRTRFSRKLPPALSHRFFRKMLLDSYAELGFTKESLPRLNLPPFDLQKGKFMPAMDILFRIRDGQVHMKPEIEQVGESEVRYVDGSTSPADVLLFATGFNLDFPFIDEAILRVDGRYTIGLYRQVFHRDYDNLAFLAMNFAGGSAFPLMEIQARWMARVFAGDMPLAAAEARGDWIDAYFARHAADGTDPMSLQLLNYLPEIAAMLGVTPQFWRHPGLILPLVFGAHVPAQYRLDGPGRSESVPDVIAERKYLSE